MEPFCKKDTPLAESSETNSELIQSVAPVYRVPRHTFSTFKDLMDRNIAESEARETLPIVGRKPGLRGNYLLRPLESLSYNQLLDLFLCGCGKTYRNVENLRGHIKKRHPEGRPQQTLMTEQEKDDFYFSHQGKNSSAGFRKNPMNDTNITEQLLLKRQLLKKEECGLLLRYGEEIAGNSHEDKLSCPQFVRVLKEMGSNPKGQLKRRTTITKAMALFLCNISQFVNTTFLLWLEEMFAGLIRFSDRELEGLVQQYEHRTGIYTGESQLSPQVALLSKTKSGQELNLLASSYSDTHTCAYFPIVAQSYLARWAATYYSKSYFSLARSVLEEFCLWLNSNQLTCLRLSKCFPSDHPWGLAELS